MSWCSWVRAPFPGQILQAPIVLIPGDSSIVYGHCRVYTGTSCDILGSFPSVMMFHTNVTSQILEIQSRACVTWKYFQIFAVMVSVKQKWKREKRTLVSFPNRELGTLSGHLLRFWGESVMTFDASMKSIWYTTELYMKSMRNEYDNYCLKWKKRMQDWI